MTVARPHPARLLKAAGQQFDYPATLVGATPDGSLTLYYDPALGQPGLDLANSVLALLPKTSADCSSFFGIPFQPANVVIAPLSGNNDGTGGAYHYGCDFASGGDLYIDAAFGNPTLTNGLVVAELTECYMGTQAKGWDCGGSGGEALSRFLAELESVAATGALSGFASAPTWDKDGRANWIDNEEATDQDYDSIGCGIVYLYWMQWVGYTPAQITQVGCSDGTLASNYKALTGKTTAWADMTAALVGLTINSDNPFAGLPAPGPVPVPVPPGPTPPPTPPTPPTPPKPAPAPVSTPTLVEVVAVYDDGSEVIWAPKP